MKKKGWRGFDGRKFLTDAEHEAFSRRHPVRYARRNAGTKPGVCGKCGESETPTNLLVVAHRIPFMDGVTKYRLTPEWLDRPDNLVWVHRKRCNKEAEMTAAEIEAECADKG
jgi:hypothetical protein